MYNKHPIIKVNKQPRVAKFISGKKEIVNYVKNCDKHYSNFRDTRKLRKQTLHDADVPTCDLTRVLKLRSPRISLR